MISKKLVFYLLLVLVSSFGLLNPFNKNVLANGGKREINVDALIQLLKDFKTEIVQNRTLIKILNQRINKLNKRITTLEKQISSSPISKKYSVIGAKIGFLTNYEMATSFFKATKNILNTLNMGKIPKIIQTYFKNIVFFPPSKNSKVNTIEKGKKWKIVDGTKEYVIEKKKKIWIGAYSYPVGLVTKKDSGKCGNGFEFREFELQRNWNFYLSGKGGAHLERGNSFWQISGKIKNVSGPSLASAKFELNFYDKNQKPIYAAFFKAKNLNLGLELNFKKEIPYSNLFKNDKIRFYSIRYYSGY